MYHVLVQVNIDTITCFQIQLKKSSFPHETKLVTKSCLKNQLHDSFRTSI
jgi:hypothetical protein